MDLFKKLDKVIEADIAKEKGTESTGKPEGLAEEDHPRARIKRARDTVEFAGRANGQAIAYVVASEPLITEWNIVACKIADQGSGLKIIAARLNAYGSQKMQKFSADPARLKQPLGLKVGARWVSFTPLLNQVQDRIQLRGLTAAEAEQLQRDIETR